MRTRPDSSSSVSCDEAALVELGVEEDGPAVVEHDEALPRRERVEPLEDADHGLGRLEPAHDRERAWSSSTDVVARALWTASADALGSR